MDHGGQVAKPARRPSLTPPGGSSLARTILNTTVVISALGYFVDIYDLVVLKGSLGLAHAALAVGIGCFAVTFLALWRLPESFGRDLDFVEGPS